MIGERFRATLRAPLRLVFPEGAILGLLLAVPLLPDIFRHIEPLAVALLIATAAAAFGVGARFGRGRPVHAMVVLLGAAVIPLLPDGTAGATLAALLVPLNLAMLALLPDRGVGTRGGLLRAGALMAQAGAVALLFASYRPAPGLADAVMDPLARIAVPGFGTTMDAVLVAYGAALLTIGGLALVTGSIPMRGLFWAIIAALGVEMGLAGGAAYILAAGGMVLVVTTLENAHALAYRDALTGLPSRRALDELLDRTARGFAVAMVDVDHFKKFNDRHGHDVGDQVLRMVATQLKETGGGARAFRYGGEEFALVFRGQTLEEARPHLDAVRAAIEEADFGIRSADRPKKKPRKVVKGKKVKRLSVTVSIGVAQRSDGSRPATEVLEAADAALYRAKNAGRNRVAATKG